MPTNLHTPIQLGAVSLRNRNFMASLTRNRSVPTNVPNDINLEYYVQRAKGGAGLILTEGTLVSQQGTEWPNAPGIWSQEQVIAWKKITDAVHSVGGSIFCQLWHVGRVAHPDMPEQKHAGKPVPGPSPISARGGKFRQLPGKPGYVTPTPVDDVQYLVEEFRVAARNAKQAGFDGVELHSANGYLIHQFIDSTSNKRTDEFGGSVENRLRFPLLCLKALVDEWGGDRVGIKINPCGGYNDMGMPLDETLETYKYYVTEISKLKLAYVQLVQYVAIMDVPLRPPYPTDPPQETRGVVHDVLQAYAPYIQRPQTAVILNGDLEPSVADKLIQAGTIDAAVFGKFWIGNPDFEQRLVKGEKVLPIQELNFHTLYVFPGQDEGLVADAGVGYTDYPDAQGKI